MLFRLHSFSLLILLSMSQALGQQSSCTTELQVGIDTVTGESYKGISAQDFIGQASKGKVAIKSLTYDDGPRRVVLVVDGNKKLSGDTRKAQSDLVKTILSSARPDDSFALVVARGSDRIVKFGEEKSAYTDAVPHEGDPRSAKPLGVLDGVMEGLKLLGEHKAGDTILVIASDLEGNRSANPNTVAKALQEQQTRMFGLALGPVSRSNVAAGGQAMTAWGLATVTPGIGAIHYEAGDENFLPITVNSGGAVLSAINGDARHDYSMKDPKVEQQVKHSAQVAWNMIASFYRMEISRSENRAEEWTLQPDENLRKSAPRMVVLYPHQLGPCK
jgi:hypothetical protein